MPPSSLILSTMMRYRLLLLTWFISDLILFLACYGAAYFWRVGFILSTDHPFDKHMIVALLIAPFWLSLLTVTRIFALTRKQLSVRSFAYIAYAAATAVALFALGYYFIYGSFFSRLLLIYAFLLTAVLTWTWHILFEKIKGRVLRACPPVFPTLIIGITRESTRLIKQMNKNRHPLKPVAVLDARGSKEKEIAGVPVRGKLNKFEEVLNEGITHVIQCSNLEQTVNILQICQQKGVTYGLLPSLLGTLRVDENIFIEDKPVSLVRPAQNPLNWFFR